VGAALLVVLAAGGLLMARKFGNRESDLAGHRTTA
jgi:hypothetical protein